MSGPKNTKQVFKWWFVFGGQDRGCRNWSAIKFGKQYFLLNKLMQLWPRGHRSRGHVLLLPMVLALMPLQKFPMDFKIFLMEMPCVKWKWPCPLKIDIPGLMHYMRQSCTPLCKGSISWMDWSDMVWSQSHRCQQRSKTNMPKCVIH